MECLYIFIGILILLIVGTISGALGYNRAVREGKNPHYDCECPRCRGLVLGEDM